MYYCSFAGILSSPCTLHKRYFIELIDYFCIFFSFWFTNSVTEDLISSTKTRMSDFHFVLGTITFFCNRQ